MSVLVVPGCAMLLSVGPVLHDGHVGRVGRWHSRLPLEVIQVQADLVLCHLPAFALQQKYVKLVNNTSVLVFFRIFT